MSSETHSYYDWQVSTLLLAYDAVEPLSRNDDDALARRQQSVERELYELVQAALPKSYLDNPQTEFPPEMVILLTKATLQRAATIVGLVEEI